MHEEDSRSTAPIVRRTKKKPVVAIVAVAMVLMLVGAACSDDKTTASTEGTSTTTTSAATSSSVAGPTSGPGSPAPQPLAERTKVTIAIPQAGIEAFLPGYLAKTIGEFEKENLDVEIQTLPIPETLILMEQGEVDISPGGYYGGLFNTISQGGKMRMIAASAGFPADSKAGLWIRKDLANADGTVDPCVLRGKTLSFGGTAGVGATSTWWIADFLNKCKDPVSIKDIKVSTLGGPDLLAAMESGAVDGGFLPDPLWADPDTRGYAVQAVESYRKPLGGWAASKKFMENTEAVDAFVRAMVRTTRTYLQGDYHKQATPEVRAAIIESLGVPAATYDAGVSSVFDPDMTLNVEPIPGVQAIWLEAGGILSYSDPLPASDIVDDSVLERVIG